MHSSTWARTRLAAAMMDGPDLEIDGLEAAEGALDIGQAFVGADGRGAVEDSGLTLVRTT